MRIIGGKDYYDGGLAYGQDTDVVFVRTGKVFEADVLERSPLCVGDLDVLQFRPFGRVDWRQRQKYRWEIVHKGRTYRCYYVNVYVAGTYYGGIQVVRSAYFNQQRGVNFGNWVGYYWTLDKFKAWLTAKEYDILETQWWGGKAKVAPSWSNLDTHLFNRYTTQRELDWLIDNRVSVALCINNRSHKEKHEWAIDTDCLKTVEFAKRLDPYACFQELAMWVGGVLPRNPNPMVEITDDKVKRDKHGFDDWSFKKKVR